ncbi:MAG: PAS domain S-box protein [Opitutaceae bacterium]|nr:PAS domain S-box protein [Opitutaceae bacterium]
MRTLQTSVSETSIASSGSALVVLDSRRRVRRVSSGAAALLECGVEELLGKDWNECAQVAGLDAHLQEEVLQGRHPRDTLYLITIKNVTPAPDLLSDSRWVEPWQHSVELALVRGTNGRVRAVNQAFARKFGVPARNWPGQDPAALIHSDDQREWRHAVARLSHAPYRVAHENRWLTAQGWRWLAWEENALRDDEGQLIGFRAIGRDVTKRRLAEEHYHKLANAVEQSPLAVVIAMPDGRVQYVNPRFTQVTGYTLEEIFEKEVPVLRSGFTSDADYDRFFETVREGRDWRGELCTPCKNNRQVWEFVQVSPIRNHADEITHLLCLREDITERKKLEEQLRQAQKMESIGTLAGGIAHDFNNMLAIISGFTEIAMARTKEGDDQLRFLKEIHNASQRAVGLVRQILTFSRKAEVSYRPVAINRLIRDLGNLFSETFPRTIGFEYNLEEGLPMLAADQNQLQQVIMNLCVNARDAMADGGKITLETARVRGRSLARLNADVKLDYVSIRISDTGCGIPESVRARIFEPFFTTKQDSGGTGLGLAVVYGVVSNHRGFIEVESTPGLGSSFIVHLPIETADPLALIDEGGAATEIPVGTESVLVIEDESSLRTLLRVVLEMRGYRVRTVADGGEALELLLGDPGKIDAVLLDLNLPKISGVEVYTTIRRICPDARVLILSGNISPEVRATLEAQGQRLFVAKPYRLHELGRQLRRALDEPKAPKPSKPGA